MIDRLAEDHANARRLAEAMADMDGITSPGFIAQPTLGRLDPARVTTNFVLFGVERDRGAFLEALAARGVLFIGYPHGMIRAVPHYGISSADIDTVIDAVAAALRETASGARAATASEDVSADARPGERTRPRVAVAH
jgi:threonine aldolase